MAVVTDPNELASLTELANREIQHSLRKVTEFSTSSRWQASAIVLQVADVSLGYQVLMGFELRTPLECPINDTLIGAAGTREEAVRQLVERWRVYVLAPALAIHSKTDPRATLGETAAGGKIYSWRMAQGTAEVRSEDAGFMAWLARELGEKPLFSRLDLASILPFQQEIPLLCLKLHLLREAGGSDKVVRQCKLNHEDWPAGLEALNQYHLPAGSQGVSVLQYYFIRRTGKGPAKPVGTASAPVKAPAVAPGKKKPWWKLW
jgi:hypothetical protein